jgi:hypothetical protein
MQPRKSLDAEADLVTSGGRQHRPARHGERVSVPSGSSKIVAWAQRSEEDEPPVLSGRAGAPRTREALSPPLPVGQVDCIQLEEDAGGRGKESDPSIVVRDGCADHTPTPRLRRAGMAKGRAERQREHSTHRGRRLLPIPVPRTLLAKKATIWFNESDTEPSARLSEEPCAGEPHAGICEGGTR